MVPFTYILTKKTPNWTQLLDAVIEITSMQK